MISLGRPISLNRTNLSKACLDIYWSNGINNISYNDVIKSSSLSKGSFYKLFINEDDLQAETLNYYMNNTTLIFNEIGKAEDLFQLLKVMNNWKFAKNMKYCYFLITCTERHNVGKRTRYVIDKITKKNKKILNKVAEKHIRKYNINSINIINLVNYLFNNFILISVLYRNKFSISEITAYKETLFSLVNDITNNKNNNIFN